MTFFDFLTMVGGLALFLYGMQMLGEGLTRLSGSKLESILAKLTSSPLKGVLVGAAVTGVIQSSSATTVMVVGFVNSGMMNLNQAVGIIMGANIGTTVTSWILGLTGIDSSSFWIQLCKPTSFSPILAIIGVALMLFSKKDKSKSIATIMLGFAVLMFGMETMSGAVEPLAEVPEFTNLLLKFSNPVLGVFAGFALTAIIQSSSASVGILQALCMTGAVSYSAAIPIIMGQNIGTCVTAMISSIGANKNARRAALVHLYFNMIGTVVFLSVFYIVNAVHPFTFMPEAATPFGIAAIHSFFNVTATIYLMPFSKFLVKLACLTVKDDPKELEENHSAQVLQLLDARFLEMPSYAVEQSRSVAVAMSEMAEESMNLAMGLIENYNEETAARVCDLENQIDQYEDELENYLVKVSAKDMPEKDSLMVSTLLHCIGDFERISDHALNIKESAEEIHKKELEFSEKAKKELAVFEKAIHDILKITMLSFAEEDIALAGQVEPLEEVIDGLNFDIRKRHVKRLRKGKCTVEMGFILSDISTNFERVSDHCSNIALSLMQENGDEIEPHAYVEELKTEENLEFNSKVTTLKERYQLP